jgi:hypothetical protein
MLRDRLQQDQVSLFSYCITSNHVHLLLRPDPTDALLEHLREIHYAYFNEPLRRNRGPPKRVSITLALTTGDPMYNTDVYIGGIGWSERRYI